MDSRGVDLTAAELTLLGLYLTDGTYYRESLIISQSAASDQLPIIERAIADCGFHAHRSVMKRTGKFAKYAPNVIYRIGKRQLAKLAPFMRGGKVKCLDLLDELTVKQLSQLLIGMQIGDGKKNRTVDWTPRTYTLCLGNDYEFIDKFQSLCIRKGYRCNLGYYKYEPNDWNKAGEHGAFVYVKRQPFSTVCGRTLTTVMRYAGKSRRCQIEIEKPASAETVWCIRNQFGTIVTRRKGKVAIVGNCGRVFRKHPSKEYAQIVQCKQTRFAFPHKVKALAEWVWVQGSEEGQWRSVVGNENVALAQATSLRIIANSASVKLPQLIQKSLSSRRRRSRGESLGGWINS
jgi:hypothetical protein